MDIKLILEKHAKWARGEDGGERADLCGANLCGANLYGANLRGANLRGANLRGANLCDANLRGANLCDADLRCANLCGANLCGANLCGADLRCADLRYANLRKANLRNADLRGVKNTDKTAWDAYTAFYPLQCPETGSFIGYKKAADKIVMLEICADAKRSSATSRKCRCNKAKVLSITHLDGSDSGLTEVRSNYSKEFVYRVGEIAEVSDFDDDRWNECAAGIHFFITRDEAVKYY